MEKPLSSLVLLLATSAFALDCGGRDPDLCAAANAAAAQINDAAGRLLISDNQPNPKQRPIFLYNQFRRVVLELESACPDGFQIEGTIGGHWDRYAYGPRSFEAQWGDLDGTYGGSIEQGYWVGTTYTGFFEGDHEGRMGPFRAEAAGSRLWMVRDEGVGGGVKVSLGYRDGFLANVYGSCAEAPPLVVSDHYELVGNTALIAGSQGWGQGEVVAPNGLFDNDPDGAELVVVGVTDGTTVCEDTAAPFDCTTSEGGLLMVEEDGTFAYLPPTGAAADATDGFQVLVQRVTGGPITPSFVELSQVARVWYLDGYGSGTGGAYDPAGYLEDVAGTFEDGDIVYVGGDVYTASGIGVSGNVRILGGESPLIIDVPLNGQPSTEIQVGYSRGRLVAGGGSILRVDTDDVPASVQLENLELGGDSGAEGMVTLAGRMSYELALQQVLVYGSGTAVQVVQPDGIDPQQSRILVQDSILAGPITSFDLHHGGQADTLVSLAEVQVLGNVGAFAVRATDEARLTIDLGNTRLEDTQSVFDLQLDGMSSTQLTVQNLEVYAGGTLLTADTAADALLRVDWHYAYAEVGETAFGLRTTDGSEVYFDVSNLFVESGDQFLQVESDGFGPGFGAYLLNSDLYAGGQSGRPGIEVTGRYEGKNNLVMADSSLYYAGSTAPAIQVHGDHASETSLTMVANGILSQGYGSIVDVRTQNELSQLCLDFAGNYVQPGQLRLRQQQGSIFMLAGLYGSGSNPSNVVNFLESQNQGDVGVEQYGSGVEVNYDSTSHCMLPDRG